MNQPQNDETLANLFASSHGDFLNKLKETLGNEYELVDLLSQGAMGQLWRVRNVPLNRIEALKVLKTKNGGYEEDEIARFRKEAQVLAELRRQNRNLFLPEIFTFKEQSDFFCYSMECIEGKTLRDYMNDNELSISESVKITRDLLTILQTVHSKNIIHRDVKPENVIIDNEGNSWLVDFGIIKEMDNKENLTEEGSTLGTPRYMSPEQAQAENVGPQSDVYAVGVILYEMLANDFYVEGQNTLAVLLNITRGKMKYPSKLNKDVDKELEKIFVKSVQKVPQKRYQSAQQMNDDLARYIMPNETTIVESARALPKSPTAKSSRPLQLTLVVVLLLFVVGYFVFPTGGAAYSFVLNKDETLDCAGQDVRVAADTPFAIHLSKPCYLYKFIREGKNISVEKLSDPQEKNKNILVSMQYLKKNVDWVFFSSKQELQQEEQQKIKEWLAKIPAGVRLDHSGKGLSQNYNLKTQVHTKGHAKWNLYAINRDKQVHALVNMQVYHTPFSIDLKIKRDGEQEFESFSAETEEIYELDELQIQTQIHKRTHLAILLRDTKGEVTLLYPGENSKLLEDTQKLILPSQGGFQFDDSVGTEHLCFFFYEKQMDIAKVKTWLEKTDVGKYTSKTAYYAKDKNSKKQLPPYSMYLLNIIHE
ncbi:serine/threonine protein kinase [Candidatus Uabimicrobium amorphum]|uniref:Protein kinase n=1 Tax=Uabimicrobium amorphum TaxID=2596890 RepID=A0A5S9F5E4_UABAM|nr:serine/threonine-protein kinase [Candidatus Uabimicrobium amorphum]BBM86221.1 protein kinase [Candidatus Uabimicrobium amorphum]